MHGVLTLRDLVFSSYSLVQAKLMELQSSESTFRNEPENAEGYEKWKARFVMEEYDAEINLLLANNPTLREIYGRLVSIIFYPQFHSVFLIP